MGGSVVRYTSVIDYPDDAFLRSCLPSARRALLISRRSCWSLIVAWGVLIIEALLLTVSCKVTGFSTEEACEDFPLSVLLNGSTGVSSFPAPPYSLFISISSWGEVFCFRDSCSSPSWRRIHCVLVLRCIVMPWFIGRWWTWLCFEPVCSIFHMRIEFLLFYCSVSVTILTGKTLDSAVMTTRAEMYH
jgi:hypothetical protein